MAEWSNFYMLAGGVAGTLIGLIFVVITFSSERKKPGDLHRTRLYVTPILVYFGSLLLLALILVAPVADLVRALALGVIGCAGLAYVTNLAMLSRRRTDLEKREFLWDTLLPIAAYVCVAVSATAWALSAAFADAIAAIAVVVLLVTALRNSWMVTLAIAGRADG
jgi:hypothetical protein